MKGKDSVAEQDIGWLKYLGRSQDLTVLKMHNIVCTNSHQPHN